MALQIDLAKHTALITGGTQGIGLAIAQALGEAGARVFVVSRKQDSVDAAIAQLRKGGSNADGCAANVGDAAGRARLIKQCLTAFGGLSILVNNAAANPAFGPVEQTEPSAFAKIMQVNVEAPFELAKLALPHLRQHPNASVLNISSIGGLKPEAGLGIYSVSKAALNSLTKVLAKEWGRYDIRVNAICPGLIKTEFSQALWGDARTATAFEKRTPLGRIGRPEEIGHLAAVIASHAGGYATGHLFTADGGYTL